MINTFARLSRRMMGILLLSEISLILTVVISGGFGSGNDKKDKHKDERSFRILKKVKACLDTSLEAGVPDWFVSK